MKKDILRYIKNDMWETRHSKKDVQAMLKAELAELETRRKEALAENESLDVSDVSKAWFNRQTNETYDGAVRSSSAACMTAGTTTRCTT